LGQTQSMYGQSEQAAETFRRGADLFKRSHRELWLEFEAAFLNIASFVVSLRVDALARLESLAASIPNDRPASAAERSPLALPAYNRAWTVPPAAQHATLARRALGDRALGGERAPDAAENMTATLASFALYSC